MNPTAKIQLFFQISIVHFGPFYYALVYSTDLQQITIRHPAFLLSRAQTAMTVRVDNNVKKQFDALCEQFGMSVNAAVNVFINAVVRTRSIPFTISAEEDQTRKRALEAFYAPHPETPELTLDEINEEIRKARQRAS